MRRAILSVLMLVLLAVTTAEPSAAKRVALVVGNDAYANVAPLKKAANDALAMAEALQAIGFEIVLARNTGRREMNRQLLTFTSKLEPGDEALFFYAGHGVEIAGRNYLLPTDIPTARPGQEQFIEAESIPVDHVLQSIQNRGVRISILVLDACRNNPFQKEGTRSLGSTRGLARMVAPEGTFIMYSAGFGQEALDRLTEEDPNPNSVFTRSLIPLIQQPGVSLTRMARQVRRDVKKLAATVSHVQRPAYYDEVIGDFYFSGQAQPDSSVSQETAFWNSVKNSTDPAAFEMYLKQFPGGTFASLARIRLDAARKKRAAVIAPKATIPPPPIQQCDKLAANPTDPERVGDGVDFGKIDADAAITACLQALAAFPDVGRFEFQLGRAHDANKKPTEALIWYRKAAEHGHAAAMYNLGVNYEGGDGVAKSYEQALRWYGRAADGGHTRAMNNLGGMYRYGKGVSKSHKSAVNWYVKAVDAGSPLGQYNLGTMYQNGHGVDQSDADAVRWYRKAAGLGNAKAMYQLGFMASSGRGMERSRDEAARWYRKAANLGHTRAMAEMGFLHSRGRGVVQSYERSAFWYEKAARKGHSSSMTNLAYLYQTGSGVARSGAEAVRWYKKAADKGNTTAMHRLGILYRRGEIVAQSDTEAVRWYLKAAKKGNTDSMTNLGFMYSGGKGVAQSDTEAAYWYAEAADKGKALAMHNLGFMYDKGRGVDQDSDHAAGLVFKALELKNSFSFKEMTESADEWSERFRQALQKRLKDAGIYQGTIDGAFGPGTRAAISRLAGKS
ncbi:MAG: caspase family protein [Hyphomicrobiales bacterium]|nr:caspase family protein [Hyphomicrobiales bacterium]